MSAIGYFLTASGHLQADVRAELAVSQSIVGRGNSSVSPSLPFVPVYYVIAPNGGRYSQHELGESILLIPAAVVGRLAGCPSDPGNCPPSAQHLAEFTASFTNAIAAAAAVALLFLFALELRAGIRPAVALALIFGFTTIQWAYVHDPFDVGPTGLFLLLALFAVHRGVTSNSVRWLATAGVAASSSVLMRPASLICLPILAAYLLVGNWRVARTALVRRALVFAVSAAPLLLILGWYNWIRFGSPFEAGYTYEPDYRGFGGSLFEGLSGLLLSPGRSIFLFSPILVAACFGVRRLWQRDKAVTAASLGFVIANLLFYAYFHQWSGALAWGPRLLAPMTPFLILPLLPVLERWRELSSGARRMICALAAAGVLVQVLAVSLDFAHQTQLQLDAGVDPDLRWWSPQYSGIWRHAVSMFGLFHGSASYPMSYHFTDMSLALPTMTTLDVWWVTAWINGVNPLVILAVLGGAATALVSAVMQLRRAVQEADPQPIVEPRLRRRWWWPLHAYIGRCSRGTSLP
ncbi:MAG: hypothetical protein E6J14_10745 [Chloroflexi bacterium]|nr:MAG: hypothetical protein E6J14_10745 [Chloroflexota bacterium]